MGGSRLSQCAAERGVCSSSADGLGPRPWRASGARLTRRWHLAQSVGLTRGLSSAPTGVRARANRRRRDHVPLRACQGQRIADGNRQRPLGRGRGEIGPLGLALGPRRGRSPRRAGAPRGRRAPAGRQLVDAQTLHACRSGPAGRGRPDGEERQRAPRTPASRRTSAGRDVLASARGRGTDGVRRVEAGRQQVAAGSMQIHTCRQAGGITKPGCARASRRPPLAGST